MLLPAGSGPGAGGGGSGLRLSPWEPGGAAQADGIAEPLGSQGQPRPQRGESGPGAPPRGWEEPRGSAESGQRGSSRLCPSAPFLPRGTVSPQLPPRANFSGPGTRGVNQQRFAPAASPAGQAAGPVRAHSRWADGASYITPIASCFRANGIGSRVKWQLAGYGTQSPASPSRGRDPPNSSAARRQQAGGRKLVSIPGPPPCRRCGSRAPCPARRGAPGRRAAPSPSLPPSSPQVPFLKAMLPRTTRCSSRRCRI